MNILVVEDHEFQRKALIQMLRQLPTTTVSGASDGVKALQVSSQHHFDLILCDVRMPNMDGLAMLRELSQRGFAGSVILSSALDTELLYSIEQMGKAYGLSILGSVKKPPKRQQLRQLLRQVNSSKSTRRPAYTPYQFTHDDLVKGLENNEFLTVYQPQIDFQNRQPSGAEALLRWQHPEHGLLTPLHFLPVAEETGLMDELTELVFQNTLLALAQWQQQFPDFSASINLTSTTLQQESLINTLLYLTEKSAIAPASITLEVTETALIADLASALEQLNRVRMHGFSLAIDDFGTGYSSLSQLNNFPFTELKIDRSFIQKMQAHPASQAIVESSLELARKLGLKTVAEGVETQSQWQAVKALGCDLCQGYFIAKPMQLKDFNTWLNSHNQKASAS